jgi:HD-GYP domain-containing protein (c-di-GMP phosphodiesterase class II)
MEKLQTKKEFHVSEFKLVMALSEAADLICSELGMHQMQVAYIAVRIGEVLELSGDQKNKLIMAGLLHDIGGLSLKERMDALHFEEAENFYRHAEIGYLLLRVFEPLSDVATFVRFHHVAWNNGGGSHFKGLQVPMSSHILHLADRVAILINKQKEVLGQSRAILEKIEKLSGEVFVPEMVNALKILKEEESFWFDIVSPSIDSILADKISTKIIELNMDRLKSLSSIFSKIIDYRSRFTVTHSSGVAAVAKTLTKLVGFSGLECLMMEIAGYLHDLGKLAVPAEILGKPDKLTEEEYNVVRKHTYHTYNILKQIGDLDVIAEWASLHHETLDGSGYPFKIKGQNFLLGSRIMAVADVFTAITEDRPYRRGMTNEKAIDVLQKMVDSGKLDGYIVSLLKDRFEEVNSLRMTAQKVSTHEYKQIMLSYA